MPYLYETHLHTDESSACGRTPARDYIAYYQDQGYDGIVVTDHFCGNPSYVPDRNAPWPEQVNAYCRGYELALEEGLKRGFKVFFGIEQQFEIDECLYYGPDKAWLLAHPDAPTWTRKRWFDEVSAIGGCVVLAHPFRVRNYVSRITLHPFAHGVEAFNRGNRPVDDVYGLAYAAHFRYPVSAGSDMHLIGKSSDPLYGVMFDSPWESVFTYANAVREGLPFTAVAEAGRGHGEAPPLERPYVYLGPDEKPQPFDVSCLFDPA